MPNKPTNPQTYLGDSVYAEAQPDGTIILWLDNGGLNDVARSRIVMEPDVLANLKLFITAQEGANHDQT